MVYPPGEKLSIFTHFAPIKDFLDVYIVEQPGQKYSKTSEIFKVSANFDIYSFVQISRNLGFFASSKNVLYFGKQAINTRDILV